MSECSIEVKALEWRERVGVAGTFDAESPIGNFIASVTDEGRGLWFIVGLTGSNYVGSTVSEAKAAAQSDFDARIRSAIEPAKVTVQEEFESVRRYLAVERKAEPVASRPMLGDMPSYGRASFSDLVKAVALAIYDREDVPIDLDLGEFIGHQMVPRINFNSLNRIVSAFSTPPAEPAAERKAEPVGYAVWINGKLAGCAKSHRGAFPVYASPPAPPEERRHCNHCSARFWTVWERQEHEREYHAKTAPALPQDVINLVIAAREFLDSPLPDDPENNPLSLALEAFDDRVPYESDVEAGISAALAAEEQQP